MSLTIPRSLYVAAVVFLYAVIKYFWPAVPFDQTIFDAVLLAVLTWLGIEVTQEVKRQIAAFRQELVSKGLLK